MAGDERTLATWLASLDDNALADLFTRRGVSPAASWRDFFDAAEALLDSASIDRALARLDRRELAALVAAGAGDVAPGTIVAWGLARPGGEVYAPVQERIAALSSTSGLADPPADVAATASGSPGTAPASAAETASAAERIFTASASLADVLLAALHVPLTLTGAGAVSAADRKRLTESGAIGAPEDLDDLIAAGLAAELLTPIGRELVVTAAGEQWLDGGTVARWTAIADGYRRHLPAGLRAPQGGIIDPADWASTYPLSPEWPARAAALRQTAQRWGILAADGTVPPWSRGLVEGTAIDTDALRDALPAEIDRIYLQADLTAVAPGPLAPRLDLRLRRIARRESRAQASTYRFTAESIGAGLTDGESAQSIRAFLRELSLTGIPQPLDYVIETTASRHGSITVRSDAASPNTIVESSDAHLLDLVVIDQALRPVGLVRHGDVLVSRVGRDHLFWALADARYPVVALDEHGAPESLRRRTAAQTASAAPAVDVYARLIGSLRASGGDGDAAWLERELEQAVRTKSIIVVTAQISAAETRTFTLEATGLGGGRLRGRDRGADVERTLPISTIVNVSPA
ncbi:MAG: hypothetical protein BGO47_14610 [Microbacterium sp. 67-17]|uniref:helicase-associated domain-containing protein n=1 Tax=Microbacterium sp. 67-17 TaxID=1895782 RepID=UPI000961BB08|nr:helicase-associated domain-containing protein [Microbacterium sp. 67-17]OJV98988.1 MAG: hypothetical protein BGO47_14610 [Microbacterium sp. 67-17]